MTPIPPSTHYEILGLPPTLQNAHPLPPQTLRAAYRRALLQWHPDRSHASLNPKQAEKHHGKYSVDQIATAYAVLGDVKKRAEYDKELRARRLVKDGVGEEVEAGRFRTGGEVVDLDDLRWDDGRGVWFRGCRCGEERGFEVSAGDLEDGLGEGEVVVGCRGCSLWLRVVFGVVEDKGEDEDAEGLNGRGGHEGT